MLHLLDEYDGSPQARRRLVEEFDRQLALTSAANARGDRAQVARVEAEVAADPRRCIRFNDAGSATVYAAARSYQGGRFEIPRLCELLWRAREARTRAGRPHARLSLWILDGASAITDIGALQATAMPGALFQVASQFNCLESPGRFVNAVAEYFQDPTQGPRASISAFPGTLVRHYAAPAPDGSRFVQETGGAQLDLLADLCDPDVAAVHNGYLRAQDVQKPHAFAAALTDHFDAIRVGVHDGVEVVLGAHWDGVVECAPFRTIAQVFTSTLAGGMYGQLDANEAALLTICRQLQRAAYLGTLLAAAALGKQRVVLTLIGGGVFANPIPVIWEAILWAAERVRPLLHRDLVVVVNGRNLGEEIPPEQLVAAARAGGGELIRCDRSGATV